MFFLLNKRIRHKIWRKLLKKRKRSLKRIEMAKERDKKLQEELKILHSNPEYVLQIQEEEKIEEEIRIRKEKEANRLREEWRAKDLALHAKWLQNNEKKMRIDLQQKIEEEKIRKEWEEILKKEEKANVKKQQLQVWTPCCGRVISALCTLVSFAGFIATRSLEGSWKYTVHNPEPPPGYARQKPKAEPCPFFSKTGACRFGINCSREHDYPERSVTLLFPNMYSHIGLQGLLNDDYDSDISLEYSDMESNQRFREFYFDVLPEFEKCGRVIQFKVCSNKCPHLRGNVYVQYEKVEEAEVAVGMFNGRWYAGKQISCAFVPIERWKPAICGLNFTNRCPKGDNCNFLHVFRNPGNAFFAADHDRFVERQDTPTESYRHRRHSVEHRRKSHDRNRSLDRSEQTDRRDSNIKSSSNKKKRKSRSSKSKENEEITHRSNKSEIDTNSCSERGDFYTSSHYRDYQTSPRDTGFENTNYKDMEDSSNTHPRKHKFKNRHSRSKSSERNCSKKEHRRSRSKSSDREYIKKEHRKSRNNSRDRNHKKKSKKKKSQSHSRDEM